MAVTILVCPCGKRIRAPGAVPGRVGKCPACGAALQVPHASTATGETSPIPTAAPESLVFHARNGPRPQAIADDDDAPAARAPRRGKRRKKTLSLIDRLEQWEGLVRRPEPSASGVARGLLYPFWDANGLAFLVIFPIIWWLISLPTFEYLSLMVAGEAASAVPVRSLIPSLTGLIIVLGYTVAYLNQVFLSSAMGDVRHPRWPDLDLWELIRGVFRWAWSLVAGFVAGGLPALVFWSYTEEPRTLDWVVFASLWGFGVFYAQMALVASLLFDDVLAINPVTVGQAVWRSGFSFLRPLVFTTIALVLAGGLLAAVLHVKEAHMAIGSWLLFWGFAFYEALVVMWVLGLEYHRNARALGWFRESQSAAR